MPNSKHSTQQDTRAQWTEDQRLNAGNHAANALNSPILNMVYEMMMQKLFHRFSMENLEHTKARESLYYKRVALQEVMLEMASLVTEAQEIIAARQAENDPEVQEKRHLDEQGFGLNY